MAASEENGGVRIGSESQDSSKLLSSAAHGVTIVLKTGLCYEDGSLPLEDSGRRSQDSYARSGRANSKISKHSNSRSGCDSEGVWKTDTTLDTESARHVLLGSKPKLEQSTTKLLRPANIFVRISRVIVENKYFVIFTALLTIYALTGDDIRLLVTPRPADKYFDIAVITCLAVFSIEIILSCLGKEDYFLSFFFALDVISTGSLILDLSPVSTYMAGGDDEDDQISTLRGGRTARAGARAGRIVRVIRLVRILKLYKAFYETRKKQRRAERSSINPGDEGWDPTLHSTDSEDTFEKQHQDIRMDATETRVGRKLSETTIRRVIILVLTMLLVLPWLDAQDENRGTSGNFGADHTWRLFVSYLDGRSSYDLYATEFLDFVFYHNWFSTKGNFCSSGKCSNEFFARLFWFGMMGKKSEDTLVESWAKVARLNATVVSAWEKSHRSEENMYNYGQMPPQALQKLSSQWTQGCHTDSQARWGISLLSEKIDGIVSYEVKCPEDLRIQERLPVRPRVLSLDQLEERAFCFYFDLRPYVRLEAANNLTITGFICVVLTVASLYFSSDANRLVLNPVEAMIKRVEAIRAEPLIAMKMADEEVQVEEAKIARQRRKNTTLLKADALCTAVKSCVQGSGEVSEPMETVILEKTIIKLGSLLALGFGEAGANIIGHNMRGSETAGINAMIPGRRVDCIIGVARIRDFAVATEVLREKIMTFSNQVAEIVHGVTSEYHGAVNKNNGDSFTIIWQIGEMKPEMQCRMADLAVMAFSKAIASVHRSWMLAEYRAHPGLQQRLGSKCRVNVSFALHAGWAIEGAVGSEFKIDASYLSPNVSIAGNLGVATEVYGVAFIVAESVVDLCSEEMANNCRLIDIVITTGSQQSMRLFSVDLEYMSLPVLPLSRLKSWTSRNRFKARQFIENEKSLKLEMNIADLFNADHDISRMRRPYIEEFFQKFNMGYQNYWQGEWSVAQRMLVETTRMLGWEDGPSKALLNFMQRHAFEAPKDWKGVRMLELPS